MKNLSVSHQATNGAFTVTFYHFMRHSCIMQAAEAAMQKHMNSNLQNCVQTVFDQFKQSTKAYQLSVDGDIYSLREALI